MTLIRWSLLALVTGSLACGGKDVDGGNDTDGNNANAGDGDGDAPGDGDGSGDGDDTGDGDGDSSNGDGDMSTGDGDGCQEFSVFAKPTTPDMLIVLDRSSSMNEEGASGQSRWRASSNAVKNLTSELQDAIRFGLMTFPESFGGGLPGGEPEIPEACTEVCANPFSLECFTCVLDNDTGGDLPGGDAVCGPGKLEVEIGLGNGDAIASVIDGTIASGGTPTGATLMEAANHIGSGLSGPDMAAEPKYVLLVTDGQPTCPKSNGTNEPPRASPESLAADRVLTVDAIKALRDKNVYTYVIGYDVTEFADAMNEFAQTGGTQSYRPVEDEASLLEEFRKIAGEIVSCTFVLEGDPPSDANKVEVKVDGQQVYLDDPEGEGFTLDGKTITLQDKVCEGIQDGEQHQVDVKVTCEVIVPPVK